MTAAVDDANRRRRGGRPFSREAQVWGKRRVTIPRHVFKQARLRIGDRLRAKADGPGRVVMERIEAPASIFDATGGIDAAAPTTEP